MIDLAVGMIIGTAFNKIVSSLVNDVLMPLIAAIFRLEDFSALKVLLVDKGAEELNVYLNYGQFIQNVVDFLIIAFCIFLMIKGIMKLKKKKEEEPAAPPAPSKEEVLLTEIRDLLKEKK